MEIRILYNSSFKTLKFLAFNQNVFWVFSFSGCHVCDELGGIVVFSEFALCRIFVGNFKNVNQYSSLRMLLHEKYLGNKEYSWLRHKGPKF